MHGLDTSNVSSRVESSQVEFEPKILIKSALVKITLENQKKKEKM